MITWSLSYRDISRSLRSDCNTCQVNQTRRHKPYGALNPIASPSFAFHTITIDFVLGLPEVGADRFDTLLTITDKFSKRVALTPGRSDWNAECWAHAMLDVITDWGVPKAIISDRDPKFLAEMWKGIFRHLGTKLLMSTAYHP